MCGNIEAVPLSLLKRIPPQFTTPRTGGNHIVMHRIKHVLNSYVAENGRM
jgi:hypothetical protein